jgi:L-ribulokinase
MNQSRYSVGVDYGTEAGRAVLVDLDTGQEIATEEYRYLNGVIDTKLPIPGKEILLKPDWALQDPEDYIRTLRETIPVILRKTRIAPENVVGIGIDCTACTMLPVKANGTPLCTIPDFRSNPHSWVKLWKHHSAQSQADRINDLANTIKAPWLQRYGNKISAEWFFPKVLQILDESPDIFFASDRLIEAGDWVVWQLTGKETRNSRMAAAKAIWSKRDGFPSDSFFADLDPKLRNVVNSKLMRNISPVGKRAGVLTERAAIWTGLKPNTPVAVATTDGQASVLAATISKPGQMLLTMGTSIVHFLLGNQETTVPGICEYMEDDFVSGHFGYEAGQSCVGDTFAWFVENCVPDSYVQEARQQHIDVHELLIRKAHNLIPGESGLLALDWWNGNRSILADMNLSGLLLGVTLSTKPEEIYRALIEATAFGTRVIIDTFEKHDMHVRELVACGGLPERNELLMQVFSDITGREIRIVASKQASALGSAILGAVAAGGTSMGYNDIHDAIRNMAHLSDKVYRPIREQAQVYDILFAEYVRLHDYFGLEQNSTMKILRRIRDEVVNGLTYAE